MRIATSLALLGTAACLTPQRHAPAQSTAAAPLAPDASIARDLDAYLSHATAFGFGGQVLVAHAGRVIFERAYGWADRTGTPMTTTTAVGIASASKQFTAATVLALVDKRQLALDDTLGGLLPNVPADKRRITVQQLLTHTAGLQPGITNDFEDATLQDLERRILDTPLERAPGGRMLYGSENYMILADIVQHVTREPYPRAVRRLLFEPARMTRTRLVGESFDDLPVAHAYVGWMDSGSPATWPMNWRYAGGGDVVTTAGDLFRWLEAVHGGRIFGREMVARYDAPQVPLDDGGFYGYGLMFDTTAAGRRYVEHGGDTDLGFNSLVRRYPVEKVTLIITSNGRADGGLWFRWGIQDDIDRIIHGVAPRRPLPAAHTLDARAQTSIAGSYATDSTRAGGARLHVVPDGPLTWIAAEGQTALEWLRPSLAAERPAADSATAAATALFTALRARDPSALERAIADSTPAGRRAYLDEWATLVQHYGALLGWTIQGATPEGRTVRTFTVLHFTAGDQHMIHRWLRGRPSTIVATNTHAPDFPIVLGLAATDSGFAAYPLDRPAAPIEIRGAGDRLTVTTPAGPRTSQPRGQSGWRPPHASPAW